MLSAWSAMEWWAKVIVLWTALAGAVTLFSMGSGASSAERAAPNPAAVQACQDAIYARATNKSSVDFYSISHPPEVQSVRYGNLEVLIKFSAKNGFGSESISIARCILSGDGRTLIELTSRDSR